MRVLDVMTSPPISVGPDTPLKEVAKLLVEHRITGVPVVESGSVLGVVSQADIVVGEQQAEEEFVHPARLARLRRRLAVRDRRKARDVMTSPAVTVDPWTSAVGAAWAMTQHDVSRLAVVEDDRLVGVVTRSDLVRAFARSDDQVRREIVEEVLPALAISPNDVEVTVANGEVVLRGEVEDELEARCLPHAVRGVLGVIAVTPELTARHPQMPFGHASVRP